MAGQSGAFVQGSTPTVTLTNATFAQGGPFGGQMLVGGYAALPASALPASPVYCLDLWGRFAQKPGAGNALIPISAAQFRVYIDASTGQPVYESSVTTHDAVAQASVLDGNLHHFRLVCRQASVDFYVDGSLANSDAATLPVTSADTLYLGVDPRDLSGTATLSAGNGVAALAILSGDPGSGNFTPPAAPYTAATPNLVAYVPLNGDASVVVGSNAAALIANSPVLAADAVVDRIGFGVHVFAGDSDYVQNKAGFHAALQALKPRHIRTDLSGVDPSTVAAGLQEVLALVPGMKIHFLAKVQDVTPAQVVSIIQQVGIQNFSFVEGTNEPDNELSGDWAGQAVAYQTSLYQAVKAAFPNLPVGSPALLDFKVGDVAAIAGAAPYCDYVSIHAYNQSNDPTQRFPETTIDYGAFSWYIRNFATALKPGAPYMFTESAYTSAQGYLTEFQQGQYDIRVALWALKNGVSRTILWQMASYGGGAADGESNYGKFRFNSWAPKPSATALQNFIALLADPGAAFATTPIGVTVSGGPSTVQSLVCQRRNGSYQVILWDAVASPSSAPEAAAQVTVTTSASFASAEYAVAQNSATYMPASISNANTGTGSPVTSVTVPVSDSVTVLHLVPASGTIMTALPGPRGPLQGPNHHVLAARSIATKAITLNAVAAQTAGESFAISGAITGFSTAPALQYRLNGGTALSFPTPPAISADLTRYTALLPAQSAGTLSLAVADPADGVTSNPALVTVSVPNSGGTPGLLPTITIQANTTQGVGAPVAFGHVFARGDVPAAYFQRLTASAPGGQTMQLQAAQTNAWPDGSLRYATLFGRSPVAFAAGQSVAFQLGTAGSAISGAALTPAQVAAGWTQHTFGGDYTSYSYTVEGGSPPAYATLAVLSNGALTVSGGGASPLVLTQPVQGGDQLAMALMPLAGSVRTYTAIVQLAASPVPHCNGGIALRNTGTGFIAALLVEPDTGTVNVCTYSNATTFAASPGTVTTAFNVKAPLALRVVWDGSAYTFLVSQSGAASSWTSVGTFTAAQIGSPNEIGFYVDNYAVQGGTSETLTVYDWETVSGASPQAASTGQIIATSVADSFTVDAAEVVATMPQYTLTQDAGGHPLGYWELISQGPLVTEIKVKRYLKRDSDGASHAWDQAVIYLRAWSDGHGGILGYHVLPSLRSENVYGANPAGTVGGTTQANRRGITELRLNGTVVKAVGGANDPSGVAAALLQPQCGWFGANMDGSVPWTSGAAQAAAPGAIPAPSFMVAHDFTYLFRKTKMFPPYKAPLGTNAAQNYGLTETFIPGAWGSPQFVPYGSPGGYPWPQGLNTTGDNADDERIGYVHLSGLRCLLNPLDRNTEIRALKHGWLWGEWEVWQTDERSGKPVNCGTTAVGPSTPNPNFATYYNGGAGSPPWMGNINVYTGSNIHDWQNYNSLMDVSHQPSPWIAPLLRTGHAAFQDIAVASACAIAASYTSGGGNVLFDNVQYDCIWTYFWNAYANDRGAGWGTRITGTCHRMMSDADPMRPYIRHIMDCNVAFAAVGPLNPSQFSESSDFTTKLGLMYMSDDPYASNCGVSSDPVGGEHLFANGIRGLCWGVEAWLNYSPNWTRYLNLMAPTLIDTYDDQLQYNGQNGNFGYFLEWYALAGKDTKGNVFQNTATQVATCAYGSLQIPLPPYPATSVFNPGIGSPGRPGGTSIGEQSPPIVAGINMQTWLPVPTRSSKRVAEQIKTRVNTPPLSGQVFSGVDGWYPTWAIEIAGDG